MRFSILLPFVLAASSALFGQYKSEAAAAPPSELPPAVGGLLDKQGVKVTGPGGTVLCELWFRTSPPPSANLKEEGATVTGVAHGAFMGVVRFPAKGNDRRGQGVNPGVYTLRLSFHPINGDHQGVAPQRDFLVLSPAAADTDPAATPNFDTLMEWSKKASGTPHPAVLSMWKVDGEFKPGMEKHGEQDWTLQVKIGGAPIAIILVGKAEG